MDWLGENIWLVWMALALLLFAIEAGTVDFVFVMIGIGALCGGFTAALGASLTWQVVVASVVAMLLTVVVRPMVKARFLDTEAAQSIGSGALVGRSALVVETVTRLDGRIRLDGELWSARAADGSSTCEPDEEVRVVAIDGATAIVSKHPRT